MPEKPVKTREASPAEILGVSPEAGEEEIRAAYLKKVKQYPPDRAPDEFEAVRAAYEIMRDPRHRARIMLMAANPWSSPLDLMGSRAEGERRFIGPTPWLEALQKTHPHGRE